MMKTLIGIFAVAAVAGTSALAADIPLKVPKTLVSTPPSTWNGFYVGGNVGYGWGSNPTVTFSPNDSGLASLIGPGAPVGFRDSGALGGFQAGYNWQFNQTWLAGLEADFDLSNIKGSGASTSITPTLLGPAQFSSTASERINWFGTVRARLGYLPTSSFLVYGTGGFAYGRVTQNASYINNSGVTIGSFNGSCNGNGTTCYVGASARNASGWTAGGGLEYSVWKNWTVKAEYLYVNLGNNSFNENGIPAPNTSSFAVHFNDTAFHVVRAGANYKF